MPFILTASYYHQRLAYCKYILFRRRPKYRFTKKPYVFLRFNFVVYYRRLISRVLLYYTRVYITFQRFVLDL